MEAKHAAFAREYVKDHNGTQAAKRAGYSPASAHSQASRLLKTANVQQAIVELEAKVTNKTIADLVERKQFWTYGMREAALEFRDRLKSSELLGKSEGDFQVDVKVGLSASLEELVLASFKTESEEA